MTAELFGNVGISFYDSDQMVQVKVEKIPSTQISSDLPILKGYYRVSFASTVSSFYLLLNKDQLLLLCDDLDAESSDFLYPEENA